jgi:hypothetical protein
MKSTKKSELGTSLKSRSASRNLIRSKCLSTVLKCPLYQHMVWTTNLVRTNKTRLGIHRSSTKPQGHRNLKIRHLLFQISKLNQHLSKTGSFLWRKKRANETCLLWDRYPRSICQVYYPLYRTLSFKIILIDKVCNKRSSQMWRQVRV